MALLYPQTLGSLFVASYDSQRYGGGSRSRLHARVASQRTIDSLSSLGTYRIENTSPNSSIASRSYQHGPRREHIFLFTPLLRVAVA
jgi:hypothetical protein